jgi:hypothetical protein
MVVKEILLFATAFRLLPVPTQSLWKNIPGTIFQAVFSLPSGSTIQNAWNIIFTYTYIPGVHQTSYKMGTRASFPGVKWQGREADHSPPTSAEVKKMWIYTSTNPYVFMA